MRVEPVAPLARPEEAARAVAPAGDASFGDVLAGAVKEASRLDHAASAKAEALAAGTIDDLHGTMIASKEAEISIHLVGSIRNKLLDAFHELWRTGI